MATSREPIRAEEPRERRTYLGMLYLAHRAGARLGRGELEPALAAWRSQ